MTTMIAKLSFVGCGVLGVIALGFGPAWVVESVGGAVANVEPAAQSAAVGSEPAQVSAGPSAAGQAGTKPVDFGRDVRPILAQHCYACHGPDAGSRKAKLRLDTFDGATHGDVDEAAIVPGHPEKGQMLARVTSDDPDDIMPPPKKGNDRLTPAQIDILKRWVAQGAKFDQHWAFVAPKLPALPTVDNDRWSASPIDRLVYSKLQASHLKPQPPADKHTLLRRVSFDLIGLPPTPQELAAFDADTSPDALQTVVTRLLASPAFGEKWARQWLDLARYADSNGYQRDGFRTIWPWRDWVIKSLNSDKPYDQFLQEQIAGDLMAAQLPPGRDELAKDLRVATGFFRNTTVNVEAGTVPEADRAKQVADRVNMFGTVFLGLTVECAQCHDHKFDPIPTKDYYGLFAYFNNTPIESKYRGTNMATLDFTDEPSLIVGGSSTDLAKQAELKKQLAAMEVDCATEVVDPAIKKKVAALKKQIDALPVTATLIMQEMPEPRKSTVLVRGQFDQPGDAVQPHPPTALHPVAADASRSSRSANRLDLARWLTEPENPITARVAVNRWWAELFGRGIVATPEDFGTKGDAPSNPQLLDWLALELQNNGWSMKHLLRQIVTSQAYAQSARVSPELLKLDPDNALISRGPRNRLPAEAIRDNALSVAGLLSTKQFGPPVSPPQPAGIWRVIGLVDNTYRPSKGEDGYRRGIYTIWRRSSPYPAFLNFDANERSVCTVQRTRSNTPLQALTLLNDAAFVEAAQSLAKRIQAEAPSADADSRIAFGFELCTSRSPKPAELGYLRQTFEQESGKHDEKAAYQFIATILLNLDETISR